MAVNLNTIGSRKRSVLYFLLSFIVALILTILLKEPSFTTTQVYILFILFFAIGLWFTEAVPAFAVSVLIIAYLVFMLGNKNLNPSSENIDQYVTTFSSSVIWLMLGGFFMATAMTKTKLDEALFRFTLKISGTNPRSMLIAAIMPLLNSLGKESGLTKALLLGVPIAATTGGMGSVIGSPPNLIAVGALENMGINISFLDWMKFGLPIAIALTAVSYIVLTRM